MFTNALPSEVIDVLAAIDPDAYSAAAVSSGYADMSDYEALLACELAGVMVTNSTLDMKLQSATTASGGADITGKAITTLTEAGSDDDKQALINLRRDELTEGHRYVKMLRTLGTAGADEAALLLGIKGVLVPNCKPSEVIALVGTIDPDAYTANTYTGDPVDMSDWHAALGVLMIGTLGSGASVSMKWEQATTSGGTYKDVTGAATSTITDDSPDTQSDQQVKLDLRADDLDAANGYRYARLSVTVADATSDVAAVAFGVYPKVGIASASDLASVDEIV